MKTIRCAIYTRKSVDEGLEDACNSLDSQREFCENYIKAQSRNGWVILPKHYDDGGYSGKNMKRPAMQELLKDVENGEVDVIVAYKVDRLSRSLLDFANFSLFLEERNVSFVLVTQNIDTTTTMGRMQLNLLMTFAQYEREMCSDRIKDKVAVMKQRGMWTGGYRPYGYDIKDKQLFVNKAEAKVIKQIFNRYIELGSTKYVAKELNSKGILYNTQSGKWDLNIIYRILQCKIYIGVITHQGKDYEGQHEAIISKELWDKVQTVRTQRGPYCQHSDDISIALFRGMIFCGECNQPMRVETHVKNKTKKKYAYYNCPKGLHGSKKGEACRMARLPTKRIDKFILKCCLQAIAQTPEAIIEVGNMIDRPPSEIREALKSGKDLFEGIPPLEQLIFVKNLIKEIVIKRSALYITFDEEIFKDFNGDSRTMCFPLILSKEEYVVQIGDDHTYGYSASSIAILKAINEGRHLYEEFIMRGFNSLNAYATSRKEDPANLRRKMSLANISPMIIRAVVSQKGGYNLSINKLQKMAHLSWEEQEKVAAL